MKTRLVEEILNCAEGYGDVPGGISSDMVDPGTSKQDIHYHVEFCNAVGLLNAPPPPEDGSRPEKLDIGPLTWAGRAVLNRIREGHNLGRIGQELGPFLVVAALRK